MIVLCNDEFIIISGIKKKSIIIYFIQPYPQSDVVI